MSERSYFIHTALATFHLSVKQRTGVLSLSRKFQPSSGTTQRWLIFAIFSPFEWEGEGARLAGWPWPRQLLLRLQPLLHSRVSDRLSGAWRALYYFLSGGAFSADACGGTLPIIFEIEWLAPLNYRQDGIWSAVEVRPLRVLGDLGVAFLQKWQYGRVFAQVYLTQV